MIYPVPNTPDNPWYQKRYHNKIPKKAESKAFLDTLYALQGPPVVPTHSLTMARDVNSNGYEKNVAGSLSPTTIDGIEVLSILVSADNVTRVEMVGSVQIVGKTVITVTSDFLPAVVCTWSVGLGKYASAAVPKLFAATSEKLGQVGTGRIVTS